MICIHFANAEAKRRALGYLGGGLLLAANLALVAFAGSLGVSTGLAVRLSLLSAGLWWAGFAGVTFALLKPRAPSRRPTAASSHSSRTAS